MSVLLFAGEFYYPGGGWKDYQGSFDTLNAAKGAFVAWRNEVDKAGGYTAADHDHTWGHIVVDGEIVTEMWPKYVIGGPGWSDEIIARSES